MSVQFGVFSWISATSSHKHSALTVATATIAHHTQMNIITEIAKSGWEKKKIATEKRGIFGERVLRVCSPRNDLIWFIPSFECNAGDRISSATDQNHQKLIAETVHRSSLMSMGKSLLQYKLWPANNKWPLNRQIGWRSAQQTQRQRHTLTATASDNIRTIITTMQKRIEWT